jgi:cytochrome d ubiquinol oxidase subunit II
METLQITWFILLGILLTGYAITDGFDLGAGILSLFVKNNTERRLIINSIGPFWDGNEVWLLTGGGAMFAAFPVVYATVFSGFYLAFMLLLVALIFRAISFEFRNKVESEKWRNFWNWAFGLGSLAPSLLYGVAFGNILRGIPLNQNMMFSAEFPSSFPGLLNPFAIIVGVLTVLLFTMHGALYLSMKTGGDLQNRLAGLANKLWISVVIFYVIATLAAIFISPFLFANVLPNPLFWITFIVLLFSLVYIPIANNAKRQFHAFVSSAVMIAGMMAVTGISLFPRLVPSIINPDYSLTIYNSSSTQPTLIVMFIIALIGMPIVIGYTVYIHWLFRGKTVLDENSY